MDLSRQHDIRTFRQLPMENDKLRYTIPDIEIVNEKPVARAVKAESTINNIDSKHIN